MFFVVSLRSAKFALDNCIENGPRQSTHNKYSDKHIFENAFIGVFVIGWASWIRTSGMLESKSSALPLGYSPKFNGVDREIRTLGLQSHNLAR